MWGPVTTLPVGQRSWFCKACDVGGVALEPVCTECGSTDLLIGVTLPYMGHHYNPLGSPIVQVPESGGVEIVEEVDSIID